MRFAVFWRISVRFCDFRTPPLRLPLVVPCRCGNSRKTFLLWWPKQASAKCRILCNLYTPRKSGQEACFIYKYKMNSKRMLLRLLQQVFSFSLLFVHQTRPALSIMEESVEELIVERRSVHFDLFTVKMKTGRTCNATTCSSLGAHHVFLSGSSCECQCANYQPFTFLSSMQRCADTTQVRDFGGELIISIHHIIYFFNYSLQFSQITTRRGILQNAEWRRLFMALKIGD